MKIRNRILISILMFDKRAIFLFAFLTNYLSSIESFSQTGSFLINAELKSIPDSTVFYLENLNTGEHLDSAFCLNESFSLRGSLHEEPEELWMSFTANGKRNYLHLLIGNETVTMKGDLQEFPALTNITGSEYQDQINEITELTASQVRERDNLAHHFFRELSHEEREEQGDALWERVNELAAKTDSLRLNYIVKHPNSYPSAIHLDYLKTSMSKDSLSELFEGFTAHLKESRFARPIKVYLENRIAEEGAQYHDFEALNPDNETVRFSDLRGSYTLLDFNSVFCGFCTQARKELLTYYKDRPDSLQFVSFSVDPQRSDWASGLKSNPVLWKSLWDGEGQFSETSIKYGVNGLPSFVLIGPNGTIIKKWSGYRKGTLVQKIEALLPSSSSNKEVEED